MNLPPYLFWLEWVKKIIWDPFWWLLLMLIVFWIPFLRVWWWLFTPFFLSIQAEKLYLWWLQWDVDYLKHKWLVLEIVPPKEILIPFRAMEDVFSVMWSIYDAANFRERWCDGELPKYPYWMSWEVVSIEGKIHFFVRIKQEHRGALESVLYSHYPEIEITEVSDYTKSIPQNIPNEEWDIYGCDFILGKPNAYPIKTYEKFFEPAGERITKEEKRIDPIISLLEALARLGQGEYCWMQFITAPILDRDIPWTEEGKKIITKLAKRPEKKEKSIIEELSEVFREIIFGPTKEGTGEKATYKWISPAKSEEGEKEMLITPGEREILSEVENKIKKPAFKTTIRGVYIAKRENWNAPHRKIPESYFLHFATRNLNWIQFTVKTRTRVHYFWRKRRLYLRQRRMFRNYVLRLTPMYPDLAKFCPILNSEELATLYHFPTKISGLVAPTLVGIEFKKGGPPPNLPTE